MGDEYKNWNIDLMREAHSYSMSLEKLTLDEVLQYLTRYIQRYDGVPFTTIHIFVKEW